MTVKQPFEYNIKAQRESSAHQYLKLMKTSELEPIQKCFSQCALEFTEQ